MVSSDSVYDDGNRGAGPELVGSARGTAAAGRPWYPWGYAARVTAGRLNPLIGLARTY